MSASTGHGDGVLLARLPRWRRAVVVGSVIVAVACGGSHPFRIHNGTADPVVLMGCAQEPHLKRVISPHGTFTFSDNVGERTLSDDPGFACLLRTDHDGLVCLRVPTDQSSKTLFAVSEARPTDSFSACVRHSDPHL